MTATVKARCRFEIEKWGRNMRRSTPFTWGFCGLLAVTGCSTSPCADFLDHWFPAKPPATGAGGFGGVCDPRPAGPGVAGGPVAPSAQTPPPLNSTAPISGPPAVPAPGPTGPISSPPPMNTPPATAPYIPGAPPGTLNTLPAPDLSGIPTSTPPQPGGAEAKPLPAPPAGTPPPF